MKRNNWMIVVSIITFIIIPAIIWLFTSNHSTLTIMNASSHVIEEGEVLVCEKKLLFSNLVKGDEVEFKFEPTKDCAYAVTITLANGKELTATLGYVTHGTSFHDDIIISNNKIGLAD